MNNHNKAASSPARYVMEIRDLVADILSSRLTEIMPADLRAEQIALSVAGGVVPKIVAQALRDAADDYERAMDDDDMYTSTWQWLRARADEIAPS